MTRALINSMNIVTEKPAKMADKMPKTEGLDFGKIFESKTDKLKISKISDNKDTNTITNTAENNINKLPDNISETSNKEENLPVNINISNLLYGNINIDQEEICSDVIKDNVISLDIKTIEEIEDITDIFLEALDINTEETNIDETIITEEDPTMYNELTTLEDPTALLMLQSQIQNKIKIQKNNELSETEETKLSLNTSSNNKNTSNENTVIFKQFDNNTNVKDPSLTSAITKEHSHIKNESSSKSSSIINESIVKELDIKIISSQAEDMGSSAGDLMQNQSPQEQTTRIMIQGDIKYETVESETISRATSTKAPEVTPSKIIEQISKQLEGMFNNSKLNMVLNPGTLGKVNLQLLNSKDGLTAQFTVTTQEAKELLTKGLDGLKESLLAQGVNVDSVSVKFDDSDSEYQQDYTEQEGSEGGNKQQGARKQKDNNKEFEKMMFDLENKEDNV